jgi:hypothetical protein
VIRRSIYRLVIAIAAALLATGGAATGTPSTRIHVIGTDGTLEIRTRIVRFADLDLTSLQPFETRPIRTGEGSALPRAG